MWCVAYTLQFHRETLCETDIEAIYGKLYSFQFHDEDRGNIQYVLQKVVAFDTATIYENTKTGNVIGEG
jgi:hypothetical protein